VTAANIMLSPTAEKILQRKYYLPGEDFSSLCLRVAWAVAGAEETEELRKYWAGKYYQLMKELWFLPGGRVLANAGRPGGNLFNCGVLEVSDSRDSIYDTLKNSSEIFAHGGGIGINFSSLREVGAPVSNGSRASGPVSFMGLYDYSAGIISQTSRRGGFLAVLDVDHPDIINFIKAKDEEGVLTRFNLSVGITEDFMNATAQNNSWELRSIYHDGKVTSTTTAVELLDKIALHAWQSGDPGVLYLDRINRDNATPHLGKIRSTNLCGEIPLLPYEMCDLGSINLVKMLTEDGVDEEKLAYTTTVAIRFLDSVHDISGAILPEISAATKLTRKLGLGVMGWADVLAILGIPYDTEDALILAGKIGANMKAVAYETSKQLAEEKGAYPAYDQEKSKNIWYDNTPIEPTRNAQLLGIAPTGTISLVAGVNSGIEPFFALRYIKNVTEGDQDIKYQIKESNKYNVKTAHDIAPEDHVRMQAVWQTYIDGATSKSINLPNSATVEDIKSAIILGWKLGLKGMTVYRDGSKSFQILNTTK